jgi:hypothetical protein
MLFVGVAAAKETIAFVRHAEKPPQGLGQPDCRGLNRALAPPTVIQNPSARQTQFSHAILRTRRTTKASIMTTSAR